MNDKSDDESVLHEAGEGSSSGVGSTSFERALTLMEHLYDFAAVHAIVEDTSDGRWRNLYTSVVYGTEDDFRSVPPELDEAVRGSLRCLRIRMPKAQARRLLVEAELGSARLHDIDIYFDLESAIAGFRPRDASNPEIRSSSYGQSAWCRERVGRDKRVADITLGDDTAWRFAVELEILKEIRWSGIPLLRYPEKLGDVDEIWPSPVSFSSRVADSGDVTIDLTEDRLGVSPARFAMTGTLFANELISDEISLDGNFPHSISGRVDGAELRLTVDGIVMDQTYGYYLRSIVIGVHLANGSSVTLPQFKGRPKITVPIGSSAMQSTRVGTQPSPSVRAEAWRVGERFRNSMVAPDAERFYDVASDSGSVARAYGELSEFAAADSPREITIVDPYGIDHQALMAVVAAAVPGHRATSVNIYSEFKTPPTPSNDESVAGDDAGESRHDKQIRIFRETAQTVATLLHLEIRVFEAKRLHDRFLIVGKRIWHVGPSFNKLGQEVCAIIEIRDERVKWRIRQYLESCGGAIWKTS